MRRKSSLSERPEPDGLRRLVQRIDPAGNGRGHSRVDRRLATAARAQGPWPARACANNGTCSFPASSSWRHLGESGLRENCTSRLRGGRRSALRGASSDPTPGKPVNKTWGATQRSRWREGLGATGDAKGRAGSERRVGNPWTEFHRGQAGHERSGTVALKGCRQDRSEEPDALARTSGSGRGPSGNWRATATRRSGRSRSRTTKLRSRS